MSNQDKLALRARLQAARPTAPLVRDDAFQVLTQDPAIGEFETEQEGLDPVRLYPVMPEAPLDALGRFDLDAYIACHTHHGWLVEAPAEFEMTMKHA